MQAPMGQNSKREALNRLIDEIFRNNGRILAEADRLGAACNLTGARWQVLGALDLEQQPLTVAQIARRMGLQRQSVQRLVDILVEQQLLAYHPNPEHKRARLVDFTPAGRDTVRDLETLQQGWAESIIPEFTLEALEQTVATLIKLREKLE